MWFVIFRVFEKNFVHVRARVLEQFVGTVENDESNLTIAQDA